VLFADCGEELLVAEGVKRDRREGGGHQRDPIGRLGPTRGLVLLLATMGSATLGDLEIGMALIGASSHIWGMFLRTVTHV
jgi:hypothetical protein